MGYQSFIYIFTILDSQNPYGYDVQLNFAKKVDRVFFSTMIVCVAYILGLNQWSQEVICIQHMWFHFWNFEVQALTKSLSPLLFVKTVSRSIVKAEDV